MGALYVSCISHIQPCQLMGKSSKYHNPLPSYERIGVWTVKTGPVHMWPCACAKPCSYELAERQRPDFILLLARSALRVPIEEIHAQLHVLFHLYTHMYKYEYFALRLMPSPWPFRSPQPSAPSSTAPLSPQALHSLAAQGMATRSVRILSSSGPTSLGRTKPPACEPKECVVVSPTANWGNPVDPSSILPKTMSFPLGTFFQLPYLFLRSYLP